MQLTEGIFLNTHLTNKMSINGEQGWFTRENNVSTGALWSCIPDNSGVYEVVEVISLHPSTDAVGTSGMKMWKIKALKKGKGFLIFELFMPTAHEPSEKVFIDIEVDD